MSATRARLLQTACLFSIALVATPAIAQEAEAPAQASADIGIEDVIVTAQRREESIQRAPITIQVLNADTLDRAGITDAAGIQRIANGVEVGQGGANAQIFIRGVGGASFSPLSTPGVAFNVDSVYVGRPDGVNGNFYDIARVEVLKGPQGTLYGRNANGGSVNVITNAPEIGVTSFDINGEVGNFDLRHTSGAVNLPVGDSAALRAAFNFVDREGYLSSGANDDVQQSGRLRFRAEPSTDVTIDLTADYTHLGGRGGDYTFLPRRPGADPYESTTEPAANDYQQSQPGPAAFVADMLNDNHQDTELVNFTGQLDWDLGFANLTVLPAYRYLDSNYITHFGQTYTSSSQTDQSSLEVRLANSTDRLNWVLGGYLYREATDGLVRVYAGLPQNILIDYAPVTDAYAIFGQTTYSVTDNFRLIAGLRYTHEEGELGGSIYNINSGLTTETFGGEASFNGITYRLGVEYDVSPQSMLYLTYSTGFKAGGFSQTVPPQDVFQPEDLTSLEFGSKNQFFDNRVQLNFGLFHWSYENIQDQRVNFDPLGEVNFITFNSGDATLYGGNVDLIARPTLADTVSFSVEYTHSEYDRFTILTPTLLFNPGGTGCPYTIAGPTTTIDCSGFQMARVPEWTGQLGYSHDFSIGDNTLTFDANVKYSSARWLAIDFTDSERDGAYTTVDANLTYTPAGQDWSIGLFGRNLTEEVYYTGGIQPAFAGTLFAANIAPPRVYGIRASLHFGE